MPTSQSLLYLKAQQPEDSGVSQAGAGRPLQGAEWGPCVFPEVERPCVCEACLGEAGAGLEGWGLVTESLYQRTLTSYSTIETKIKMWQKPLFFEDCHTSFTIPS